MSLRLRVGELRREPAQSVRLVKHPVTRVQQIARGVVNVQKCGMKPAAGLSGIKTLFGRTGHGKKVAVDEPATGVAGQRRAQRNESLVVPVNHRVQRLDH